MNKEDIFIKKFTEAGGCVFDTDGKEELCKRLIDWITAKKIGSVLVSSTVFIRDLKIEELLKSMDISVVTPQYDPKGRDAWFTSIISAELGIIEANWGIKETGSVVHLASDDNPRSFSLVPPYNIVLLRRENILSTVEEFFETLATCSFDYLSVITGPSKTADIEQTLVLGAHGPKEVILFIL